MISVTKSKDYSTDNDKNIQVLHCTDVPLHNWYINNKDQNENWLVVLSVNQMEIEPEIYTRGDYVFIGVEQGIYVLEKKTGKVVTEVRDISYVQWVESDAEMCVIFTAEDEVITFDNNGQLLWRKGLPDIIETSDIENDYFIINDISGGQHKLNLASGDLIRS